MRIPRQLHPLMVLVALAGAAPELVAQDKLPEKMAGKWSVTSVTGRYPTGGTWSVVIEKQNPDGTIAGKASWDGGRLCAMDNEPFTGKLDGAQLTIFAQFRDKIPNASCGKARLVLKKGSGSDFEGDIPASKDRYVLTLSPS